MLKRALFTDHKLTYVRNYTKNVQFVRFLSNSPKKSHYDTLGVTTKATQSDIKTAYYKLSMVYHPDKMKSSDDASMKKFRDISDAYEVLGNFRLRKLYDKGILHTAGPQYSQKPDKQDEDDQTRFYKSRIYRNKAPPSGGGTHTIYDFDEWTRQHYGDVFKRRMRAKREFHGRVNSVDQATGEWQSHKIMFMFVGGCFFFVGVYVFITRPNYDEVIVEYRPRRDV